MARPAPMTDRPASRERVFRGSLFTQLRESTWLFTGAVMLPALVAYLALMLELAGSHRLRLGLGIAMLAAASHLTYLLVRGIGRRRRGLARCAWIALGDGYVRLGMSFLRPKIVFAQIVAVERGDLARSGWLPQPGGRRVGLRFVHGHSWQIAALSYPGGIDPYGELTAALQAAAAHNRDTLGIPEGAPDEVVSEAYRKLEASYRAQHPAPAETPDPEQDAQDEQDG